MGCASCNKPIDDMNSVRVCTDCASNINMKQLKKTFNTKHCGKITYTLDNAIKMMENLNSNWNHEHFTIAWTIIKTALKLKPTMPCGKIFIPRLQCYVCKKHSSCKKSLCRTKQETV